MLLRKKNLEPTTMLQMGMVCLIYAVIASRFFHPVKVYQQNAQDFATGLCVGVAIALLIASKIVERRRRNA